MARTIRIGGQDFERIRVNNNFYIDKTDFIKKWWEAEDDVTLITRPRRFGKTLAMSMLITRFWRVCLREPDTRWNRTASMAWAGRISSFATRKTGVS